MAKFPVSKLQAIMDVIMNDRVGDVLSATEMFELSDSIAKALVEEEGDFFWDDSDYETEEDSED